MPDMTGWLNLKFDSPDYLPRADTVPNLQDHRREWPLGYLYWGQGGENDKD